MGCFTGDLHEEAEEKYAAGGKEDKAKWRRDRARRKRRQKKLGREKCITAVERKENEEWRGLGVGYIWKPDDRKA